MDLSQKFTEVISSISVLTPGTRLIIGFSGGIDSMVLTHLLISLKEKFGFEVIAYHLNHGMRGEAENEVRVLKEKMVAWNILLRVEQVSVPDYARQQRISLEVAGRELRYQGLRKIKEEYEKAYIVTGHNADDLAETIFYRILTGVSIRGLSPMKIVQKDIIRPLLPFYREEIVQYALEHNLEYLTDQTNFDLHFRRNFLRHKLFPELSKINLRFREHLINLGNDAQEIDNFILLEGIQAGLSMIEEKDDFTIVQIDAFVRLPSVLQKRLLVHLFEKRNVMVNRGLLERIINLTKSTKNGQVNLIQDYLAKKVGKELHIFIKKTPTEQNEINNFFYELPIPGKINISEALLCIETYYTDKPLKTEKNQLFLPDGFYHLPLIIRNRRPGDKMAPDRLKGRFRKIQDLFIDKKIPREQRNIIPLLVDSQQILWLPGLEKVYLGENLNKKGLIVTYNNI